jgi:histidinol-phosphatase (PHP family)
VPPAQQPSDQPAEPAHASGSWSPPVDSHVHTEWSWDAPREANMVRSCEQAVAAGLPGVAFTDHLDFTTWTDGDRIGAMDLDPHRYARMHLLDMAGYLAALDDCRQRFPELRLLSGVEIGEAHLWAASAARTVAGTGVERILGSLHAIPCDGRLTAADDLFRQMPAAEVMRRYFAELVRLVEGSDIFRCWRTSTSPGGCGRTRPGLTRSGPSRRSTGPCCGPWPPATGSSR